MYWFDIGNNFLNSNSLVTLNKSPVRQQNVSPQYIVSKSGRKFIVKYLWYC